MRADGFHDAVSSLDYLLLVHVLISFCRAFYNDKGVIVHEPKAIRQHYMHTYLWIDIAACVPVYELVDAYGGGESKYAAWLRLPNILCAYRLVLLWRRLQVFALPYKLLAHRLSDGVKWQCVHVLVSATGQWH